MKDFGIIKDTIYPTSLNEKKVRRSVRAILLKKNSSSFNYDIGLLKIQGSDIFGNRNHFETPGGGIETGETDEVALRREIREETGYNLRFIYPVGSIASEYNILSAVHQAHFYIAIVDEKLPQHLTLTEEEIPVIKELIWVPLNEVVNFYPKEVENVGQLVHKRDLIMIQEAIRLLTPTIRLSISEDLNEIVNLVEEAKQIMKMEGSPQWQQGYPNEQTFASDINKKRLYTILAFDQVVGVMCVMNYEATYETIYEGKWINNAPYLVIHRLATSSRFRGLGYGEALIEFTKQLALKQGIHNIKIDTHPINYSMHKLLTRTGFTYCGIIYLNTEVDRLRYAYQSTF